MIKLKRVEKPLALTATLESELVAKYKLDGSSVWNRDFIKLGLADSSFGKCAYCECALGEEGKYLEVEHFKYKNKWPDDVVSWLNLLPSCKRCNISKSTHDVIDDPIVNPYDIKPGDHLRLDLYRLRSLTPLGHSTIEAINLNDADRLVKKRFSVGCIMHEFIEQAVGKLADYQASPTVRRRNSLHRIVEALLIECQPQAAYSATSATVLHKDADFSRLVGSMRNLSIWTDRQQALHDTSSMSVI